MVSTGNSKIATTTLMGTMSLPLMEIKTRDPERGLSILLSSLDVVELKRFTRQSQSCKTSINVFRHRSL